MIENFNTSAKVNSIFNRSDLLPALIVYSTFPTSAMVLGGVGTAMTQDVDQAYGGYLVLVDQDALHLKPLKKGRQNALRTASRSECSPADPIRIDRDQIQSVRIRPANGLSMFSSTITLTLNSGRKYVWQINHKEKALPYHEEGFNALKEFAKTIH